MNNISLNFEDLHLEPNVEYILIDALYMDRIVPSVISFKNGRLDYKYLIEKAFPYSGNSIFTVFQLSDSLFSPTFISRVQYKENDIGGFASDTGLLVIVSTLVLEKFSKLFSYDDLLESKDYNCMIDVDYWARIVSEVDDKSIAVLLPPFNGYTGGGGRFRVAANNLISIKK